MESLNWYTLQYQTDIAAMLAKDNQAEVLQKNLDQISGIPDVHDEQSDSDELDELFEKAGRFIIEKDNASIGLLQRMFRIGFNRAAKIMDQLCEAGVVSDAVDTKPRKVLMSEPEFEQYIEKRL